MNSDPNDTLPRRKERSVPRGRIATSTTFVIAMVLYLGFSVFSYAAARAQESDKDRLYLVKGAFIFYLSKYVAWPAARQIAPVMPFVFCVVDNTEFGNNLNIEMQSRTIRGMRVLVKTLSSEPAGSGAAPACDIMYFEKSSEHALAMLKRVADSPVLTIGSSEDFLKAGGAIYLFERDNKMHFRINVEALSRSRLQLTADMFDLADSIVRFDPGNGTKGDTGS